MAAAVRKAANEWGLQIESAFSGLANYCFDGLLHPDAAGRSASMEWWKRAFDVAAEVGAKTSGGPLGGMSVADASDSKRREQRYRGLLDAVAELSKTARAAGLERLQVECTPLAREIPYTVDQAKSFMKDLEGRCEVAVKLLIDLGHALYQPSTCKTPTFKATRTGVGPMGAACLTWPALPAKCVQPAWSMCLRLSRSFIHLSWRMKQCERILPVQ
jgi:sugar phosphate isomerase/epimerase